MKTQILIGMATCGLAAGSGKTFEKFEKLIKEKSLDFELKAVGCIGMCYNEPLVEIKSDEINMMLVKVNEDQVEKILTKLSQNKIPTDFVEYTEKKKVNNIPLKSEHGFFKDQIKIITKNCGVINPLSLDEYKKTKGYSGLVNALKIEPNLVIEIIKKSKLRGRGGAGFPTGLKWSFIAQKKGEKFLVCNFDEGDPGAFMNRSLVEGDPFRLIEGMTICAYAIKATKGFIYVRAEYPLAVQRLNKTLQIARENNLLGQNILGKGFDFDIEIKMGAGAYVCGEETALLSSIEGNRGNPRAKPPFPADKGLWGKPTNINNVGTLANVASIMQMGVNNYLKYGTQESGGTKVICLTGKIKRPGIIEVPMGTSLKKIIFDIGGGTEKKFKAVQIGGPSGGCIPESDIDIDYDYSCISKKGAIMGSGGIVVLDKTSDMVDVARYFLNFSAEESCGKCTPCREGTRQLIRYLDLILEKKAMLKDFRELQELCKVIQDSALCGLGQASPNPILSTIRYFENEYLSKIIDAKKMLRYTITDKCIGCDICAKVCPANAISGALKEKHIIDQDKCIHCDKCFENCRFNAIERKKKK